MFPSMTFPNDRGQALWAHVSLTQAGCPCSFRNMTQGWLKSSKGTGLLSFSWLANATGYQKRFKPSSISRLEWRPRRLAGALLRCGAKVVSVVLLLLLLGFVLVFEAGSVAVDVDADWCAKARSGS